VKKDFYANKSNDMSPIKYSQKNESIIIIEYVSKKPKLSGSATDRTLFIVPSPGYDDAPVLYDRYDQKMAGYHLKNKEFRENTRKTYRMLLS